MNANRGSGPLRRAFVDEKEERLAGGGKRVFALEDAHDASFPVVEHLAPVVGARSVPPIGWSPGRGRGTPLQRSLGGGGYHLHHGLRT